jgi:hypothetical protein
MIMMIGFDEHDDGDKDDVRKVSWLILIIVF